MKEDRFYPWQEYILDNSISIKLWKMRTIVTERIWVVAGMGHWGRERGIPKNMRTPLGVIDKNTILIAVNSYMSM